MLQERKPALLLCALLAAASLAGCTEDPTLGTVAAEQVYATKSGLISIGFTCSVVSHNTSLCVKCRPDVGCLYYQCVGGDCYTCDTLAGDPPCVGRRELGEQYHFFEAEAGLLTLPMATVTTLAASGASAGSGVVLPTGASGGSVRFTVPVATASAFYLWARVRAASESANALTVRFDNQPAVAWTVPVTGAQWRWVRLEAGGEPVTTQLAAGSHFLRLGGAEPGTYIDRVLVTDSATFTPVTETFEAENAGVGAPMVKGSTGFGGTGYVWVPNGAGAGGSAQMPAPTPVEGTFIVWGRSNAPSLSDNSFWLSANFSVPGLWELPVTTATGWGWSRAPQLLWLPASSGFIQLDRGDDGAKMDKLIVTNDPGHAPVEPPPLGNQ